VREQGADGLRRELQARGALSGGALEELGEHQPEVFHALAERQERVRVAREARVEIRTERADGLERRRHDTQVDRHRARASDRDDLARL
jgi:hypothetical protein